MNYIKIDKEDICNGDGLRVVLWLSGCVHKCHNCQNKQTWNPKSGVKFDDVAKEELFTELRKDYISGITLSGGDPLYEENLEDVLDLVNEIRLSMPEKTIWLYSGYYWEEIFEPSFTKQPEDWIRKYLITCEMRKRIISLCDVMVDGRFVDELKDLSLSWRGSANQSVIDIKESLRNKKVTMYCN